MSSSALSAASLVKQYANAESPALNDFTLQVRQGEFFGLLGPNGAGKTTAVSLCSGLLAPDSGTIQLFGKDFKRHAHANKKILGLVPQDIALYENLTAQENLIFFGRMYGIGGEELDHQVEYCLEFSRLADKAAHLVSTFSGGMKRRLNLAVGLLNTPRILFLDEPTVGIDAQSRHLIHEQLAELNRNGTTIIYTTHYMEEARELCGRIGIIDNGKIIHQGSPEALLEQSGSSTLDDYFLEITGKQLRD
jgi:ABC-2 type transport system ATP-binding protein